MRQRLASLLIPTVVLLVLINEVFTTPVYSERELSAMRERAVQRAANGEVEEALEQLRALTEVAPANKLVWGDYLLVLTRSGQVESAIKLALANPKRALPDYALSELFTAALRRNDVSSAREFARREIAQSKNARVVAETRQEALARHEQTTLPPPVDVAAPVAAEAAAAAPAVSPQAAAPPMSKRLAADPRQFTHRIASTVKTPVIPRSHPRMILAKPMAAKPAPASAAVVAPVPAATRTTRAEHARNAVRAAEQAAPGQRVALAEAALRELDAYERELSTAPAPAPAAEVLSAKLDRVRALTLANRLDAAATLFESVEGESLPLFGVMNGADLYAHRHQPERAQELLDRAERMAPDSREIWGARFYNALDREDYGAAKLALARVQDLSTSPADQLEAQLLAAMFDAYQNRLAAAQQKLEQLRVGSPRRADIDLRLALIYRWRGWAQRALETYQAIENPVDPVAVRVGQVASQVDLKQFGAARAALSDLAAIVPSHPDVQRAQAEAELRNRPEYSAQVLAGQSSGSRVNGDGDLAFEQRVYTSPLADQYRLFAHQRYDWADFPEGSGSADRIGVGGDYRSQFVDAAVELADRVSDGHWGVTASGEWRPDDYWAVFGEAQSDSTAVPLRALRTGVDGYSATVGARYRADESRDTKVAYSYTDFSDGNRRDAVSARYRQALYDDAHHRLAAIAQAYYGTNSGDDSVVYFNPSRESSLGVALEYWGILTRRYERSWSQRLVVGAGSYAQQNYASAAIWDAEYEQRWQLGPALLINYGLLYRSRVYDGDREGYGALFGGVNWRF